MGRDYRASNGGREGAYVKRIESASWRPESVSLIARSVANLRLWREAGWKLLGCIASKAIKVLSTELIMRRHVRQPSSDFCILSFQIRQ